MKRRGFLATAVAALAAPFAMVSRSTAQAAEETSPTLVEIDWYKVWEWKEDPHQSEWRRPQAKIRYRCNDGPWQVKQGLLPLQLEKGFSVEMHQGAPIIIHHVTLVEWAPPKGVDCLYGDFGDFNDPEVTQKRMHQLYCRLYGKEGDAK